MLTCRMSYRRENQRTNEMQTDSQLPATPPVSSMRLFYGSTWTETKPRDEGWWWLLIGKDHDIVRLRRQRAFGNRLCAFVGIYRQWMPLDEINNALWAGPIPYPQEP